MFRLRLNFLGSTWDHEPSDVLNLGVKVCVEVACTTIKCKCQGNVYVVQWWNKKQDNFNTKLNDIFSWNKSMISQWAMDQNKDT